MNLGRANIRIVKYSVFMYNAYFRAPGVRVLKSC